MRRPQAGHGEADHDLGAMLDEVLTEPSSTQTLRAEEWAATLGQPNGRPTGQKTGSIASDQRQVWDFGQGTTRRSFIGRILPAPQRDVPRD